MGETCCCGCLTVGQGSMIIAILHVISSILNIIRSGFEVSVLLNHSDEVYPDTHPDYYGNGTYYITGTFAGLGMSIGYLIVSCMLLKGTRKRIAQLCKPWLVWNYISLSLLALVSVIIFFVLAFNQLVGVAFSFAILMLVALAIAIYFVRVVQRFMDELNRSTELQIL